MLTLQAQLLNRLEQRESEGILRKLKIGKASIDFCSNDYLGLTRDGDFQQKIMEIVLENSKSLMGSTGSRLISGNTETTMQVESFLAGTHGNESALLFPTGYKANLALFSCIAKKNDTVLVDEYIHRSVHDGCLLSNATKWKFKHNDLDHLESLLKKTKGNTLIAIESLYSMDGDFAPLEDITELASRYQANLIVDEAHAMGVFGKGLVYQNQLQSKIFATIATYGKAMGLNGAVVLGSRVLKEYLVNFASPFIYSTAASDFQSLSIRTSYKYLDEHPDLAITLQKNIEYFRSHQVHSISQEKSPIQIVQFPSSTKLRQAVTDLSAIDIETYPVFAPTVKPGLERLRICLHQFNSFTEIDRLCRIIKQHQYV